MPGSIGTYPQEIGGSRPNGLLSFNSGLYNNY